MAKELTTISPEGLEIANSYLQYGNIRGVCEYLQVPEQQVVEVLNKREVKKYIDTVYLDMGYRNKNNIGSLLDEMIASKLEEAQEPGVYSSKDLADLLQMAHKMRIVEIKAQTDLAKAESSNIKNQTNVQINESVPFGQGNYGKLMDKLLNGTDWKYWKAFLKTADQVDELEKKQAMHEVQCEERWKTCFQRLEDVEKGLTRIESRMMGIGGTVVLFLAGVLVTLATKM